MKLNELVDVNMDTEKKNEESEKPGTYAGVHFDTDTQESIRQYQEANEIPNPVPAEKLHTTVLFSRKHLPNYQPAGTYSTPLVGQPEQFEAWPSRNGNSCLVLRYKCDELCDRHQSLMDEHEATYDFPEYIPHVTFSYDVGDMDVESLPPYEGPLNITEEYREEVDENWAGNNT